MLGKKTFKSLIVGVGLGVLVLGFQNCAPNNMESMDFVTLSSMSIVDNRIPFPSGTMGITLNPGQKITIKIAKPNYATGNNGWVVMADHLLLNPNYDEAVPTADGRSLLLPIEVAPQDTSKGDMIISLGVYAGWSSHAYTSIPGDLASPVPMHDDSLLLEISASKAAYKADSTADLCKLRPTHRFCSGG